MTEITKMFDGHEIRALVQHGEPWFVAKDVAEALGYRAAYDMTRMIDAEDRGTHKVRTPSGEQDMAIINESGLYSAILRSERPEAKAFKRWLTSEVLPSIRKTGAYRIPEKLRKESVATRNALTEQWSEHGATAPYHYINLTRKSYAVLGFGRTAKKADMTAEQIGELRVLESVEWLKLLRHPEIKSYRGLEASLEETGRALPLFTAGIAGALPRPAEAVS